jgi:ABC-type transporter Mla subunit MlaD
MIICGRISDVLNGRRGKARTLITSVEPLSEQLGQLQARLVQFVAGLPESLKWTASNFKHQQARGHGVSRRGIPSL